MDLLHKQFIFTSLTARLILFANQQGYFLTYGETYRPKETAELYASQGKGIADSLHTLRLAIDLNLFRNGSLLTTRADYYFLGDFWESLSEPNSGIVCCWGGNFPKCDADHFSIEHNGIK